MLAKNESSLLFTSGKASKAWLRALEREGMAPRLVETSGSDSVKGDFQVVVSRFELKRAQEIVSDVLAGRRKLPKPALVSGRLLLASAAIVVMVVVLVLAVIISNA